MNRLPPSQRPALAAVTTLPHQAAAPAAPAAKPHPVHSHEHERHGVHGHEHTHSPRWHGPKPRGRPAPKGKSAQARKRRRRSGSQRAGLDDDDGLNFASDEHAEAGAPAASSVQQDSGGAGDDHDEGGNERSRHERLALVRHHSEVGRSQAAGAARAGGAQALTPQDAQRHVERFVQGLAALWAQVNQAPLRVGGAGGMPGFAQAVRVLQLELMRRTEGVKRLDGPEGLARVIELLTRAFVLPAGANLRPEEGTAAWSLNFVVPLLLLSLQRRSTRDRTNLARAKLTVMTAPKKR